MVVQTKDYYLCQYFQYKTEPKKAKAKFISDKYVLELVLPIIRSDDFWNISHNYEHYYIQIIEYFSFLFLKQLHTIICIIILSNMAP